MRKGNIRCFLPRHEAAALVQLLSEILGYFARMSAVTLSRQTDPKNLPDQQTHQSKNGWGR